jgi:hypothetical protein
MGEGGETACKIIIGRWIARVFRFDFKLGKVLLKSQKYVILSVSANVFYSASQDLSFGVEASHSI